MWGFEDIDRTFLALDDFRRRMDRLFDGFDARWGLESGTAGVWPRSSLRDTGGELVLEAEVPGLSEKDLQLTLTQDTLTVAAERKVEVPEGYAVQRRERAAQKFSRSYALPTKVDVERAGAEVKNGRLVVTLPKAAEVRPRQIAVKSS
jgi:HSP20 family protein